MWVYGAMAALLSPLDEPFLAFLIARLQRTDGLSAAGATAIAMLDDRRRADRLGAAGSTRAAGAAAASVRRSPSPRRSVSSRSRPSPLFVVPGALVFGFGIIGFWTALQARVLKLRPGQAGTVSAVVTTIEFSGFLIPIGIGVVVDAHGLRAGLGCYAVLAGLLSGPRGVRPLATHRELPQAVAS